MSGETRQVGVRLERALYDLLYGLAAERASPGEKPNVAETARQIITTHLYNGGPLIESVSGPPAALAAGGDPLSSELGGLLEEIRSALEENRRATYVFGLFVLGALVEDPIQRASMRSRLEEILGPAPELDRRDRQAG